jgi:soluble lytic murein transglycosylase-like protein
MNRDGRLKVTMGLGFRAMVCAFGVLWMVAVCRPARAAEHVTLKNGFELDCTRRIVVGDRVRLYFVPKGPSVAEGAGDEANYVEVAADAVVRVETIADPVVQAPAVAKTAVTAKKSLPVAPTAAEMRELLAHAGTAHNIDADLLASVVRAESGGQVGAVSRAGAQGLMQLMPATATDLGVQDAFRADENIAGGTAYLDLLLTKYHDNIALALAAYNAGPAAVDRYHGIPPYRETQAYVARVIREFNRRKQIELVARAR